MGRNAEKVRHAIAHAFNKARKHQQSIAKAWGFVMLGSIVAAAGFLWFHRDNTRLINYSTDLIPGVLAVLIAFVPDLRKQHMAWRIAIVAVGLMWSILLWKKEALSDIAQQNAISQAVTTAVKAANKHSDEHSDGQEKQLSEKIESSSKHSDERSDGQISEVKKELEARTNSVISAFSDTAAGFNKKVDELKPLPPEFAQLVFGFLQTETTGFPVLVRQVPATPDNIYPVDFMARNVSTEPLRNGEVWVQICTACEYAKEPTNFTKIPGSDEHVRHLRVDRLNSGVFLLEMHVDVKVPPGVGSFETSFSYACENCKAAADWSQSVKELISRSRSFMPLVGCP